MAPCHTIAVFDCKPVNTVAAVPPRRPHRHSIPVRYLSELKPLRKKRRLSQAQLAELIGVEQPTVQRWESGNRLPDLDSLHRLAKVLGVTPGALLEGGSVVAVGPTLWIKGEVAAGVWRTAAEWPEADWQTFTGRADVQARADHRFGLIVSGDSMDLLYPPGTIVECVSTFGHVEAAPGKRVVLVRENDQQQFEATVKELVEKDGQLWAVPRSTNPVHRPINLNEPESGIFETRIVAVVVASIRPE